MQSKENKNKTTTNKKTNSNIKQTTHHSNTDRARIPNNIYWSVIFTDKTMQHQNLHTQLELKKAL